MASPTPTLLLSPVTSEEIKSSQNFVTTEDIPLLMSTSTVHTIESIFMTSRVEVSTIIAFPTATPTKMSESTSKIITIEVPTEQGSSVITVVTIALVLLLLLLLAGVVVVVLVLWRCRHQHTAKEEVSHTSSQTHTHPVVSLCEETGQPKLQPSTEEKNNDSQDEKEEDEMGGYSTVPKKTYPKTLEDDAVLDHENIEEMGGYSAIPKKKHPDYIMSKDDVVIDLSQAQLYASIDDSNKAREEHQNTAQAVEISEENTTYAQVDEVVGKGDPTNQLYAQVNKKKEKSERTDELILSSTKDEEIEMQCSVDQLYAQVDKKKKAADASFSQPRVAETSVDLTYAQVDDNMKGNGMSSVSL